MFVSGYVYHITGEWESKGNRINFILHKFLNLGIPYVVFSVFYITINSFIGATNSNFSLSDILFIWKEPVAQYWFLYSLLLLFVIWTVLSKWMENYQITILMGVISFISSVTKVPLYEGILEMLSSVVPFGVGTCMTKKSMCWLYEKAKRWYGLIVLIIHVVLTLSYVSMGDKSFLFSQAMALLGIIASIILIVNIQRKKVIEKTLLSITKYSFAIYLLHTIFTAAIRIILIKIGMNIYWIHVLCGFVAGYAGPVCIVIICKKIGIYDYLFAPARALEKQNSSLLKREN